MRRRLTIMADDRVFTIRGFGARDLAHAAGIRVIYAGGGWTADRKRLARMLAYLDHRNVAVDLQDHAPPPVAPATPEPAPVDEVAGLW